MKVLVTGANGLLGQAVVAELVRRGHEVRAVVRPAAATDALDWDAQGVEIHRSDLRAATNLEAAFDGVDVLVHLAASVAGDEEMQFASTVVGTERLLEAMSRSETTSLVLASSFSVYDWSEIGTVLSERSPLEADVYSRDGYAVAKIWQERVARRMSKENGWRLTVMRPGFIWGRGNAFVAGFGQRVGRLHFVVAPRACPPMTHVLNCADAFVTAAERCSEWEERTLNVVDGFEVTNWQYVGHYLQRACKEGFRMPLPYWLGLLIARCADGARFLLFGKKGKLPSLLMPVRFEARFKPLRYACQEMRDVLRWSPPHSFAECLEATYGPVHSASSPPARDASGSSASRTAG